MSSSNRDQTKVHQTNAVQSSGGMLKKFGGLFGRMRKQSSNFASDNRQGSDLDLKGSSSHSNSEKVVPDDGMQFTGSLIEDENNLNNISTTVNTQGIIPNSPVSLSQSLLNSTINPYRDIKMETVSANVYLNYFKLSQDETLIDQWFKTYLPLIKDKAHQPDMSALWESRKLRHEIANGIPVPLRGHVWQHLIGNKLRISEQLFEMFKSLT